MLPRALPGRPPMNFKKRSLHEDQTDQVIGRTGEQCLSQDGETIGYVLLKKSTWDREEPETAFPSQQVQDFLSYLT